MNSVHFIVIRILKLLSCQMPVKDEKNPRACHKKIIPQAICNADDRRKFVEQKDEYQNNIM